jgi:hypothetical protein
MLDYLIRCFIQIIATYTAIKIYRHLHPKDDYFEGEKEYPKDDYFEGKRGTPKDD